MIIGTLRPEFRREGKGSMPGIKAAQSKDDDNSTIAFLEAKIPVGQKLNLAKNFFDNNIQLIDMPGLGGPYFDDSAMTREYVENVDLVVVAIKITEIENFAK